MAEKGTVFQKGGGGTNFEQYIQSAFITTLIIKGNAPCLPTNEVTEIALQTTRKGWETDDLEVTAKSDLGIHRLLVQIKHTLTFSEKDDKFREVIAAFWKDFNNTQFNEGLDKLVVIKNRLNNLEKNHIKGILNYAKNHATAAAFIQEVRRFKEKKDRLDLFQIVITEANNKQPISDNELWRFLKCLDVLGYDFMNEGSVDETYLLNLIKLAKGTDITTTEKEIWNSLLVFVTHLNPNGGSITWESIQKDEIFKYFNPQKFNPFNKALDKLKKDSTVLLEPLKSMIGSAGNELHFNRPSVMNSLSSAINEVQLTIITGKPGAGKSASIKELLKETFKGAAVFVFKADQFNQPNLANVLTNQGINETLTDLFSWLVLIPEKIILIDSLEKLLEDIDPNNAFRQLLTLLNQYPDVKIVCTARRYAVDLLLLKFNLKEQPIQLIDIPLLDEAELGDVAAQFPQLTVLLNNSKIKLLMRTPKYLDFAVKSLAKAHGDVSDLSITGFKNMLWDQLVKDVTNRAKGLPAKREDAFMQIAVTRATEMKLFIKPDNVDEEAIVYLENDEIIIQENTSRKFAPAHDILEDWALVKHIDSLYAAYPLPSILFRQLGSEPAIRRAFRLWVEDKLIDDSTKINEFIKASLNDAAIENYWADELLIAVLKSDHSHPFFDSFKEILEKDIPLLNRCIHLVRTACKESRDGLATDAILLPIGSGWKELLFYINDHLSELSKIRFSIINLLQDWHYRLIFQPEIADQECPSVKSILLQFMDQIEAGDEFWGDYEVDTQKKGELIALFYNLAHHAKEEIAALLDRAQKSINDKETSPLHSFYEAVIEKCLTGVNNYRLPKELPDLIIQIAFSTWKIKLPDEKDKEEFSYHFSRHRLTTDDCWGIVDKHQFMPPSTYKTPAYNILVLHPYKGMKFISDFVNYSIEFFVNADAEYKREPHKINITALDGTVIEQWASWELWAAYRGITVTHDLLRCLLISLEKYLLDTAALKSDISRKNLNFIFDFLLKNSNNVAVSSILASVSMAYPEEVGAAMIPLLSVREFYEWDSERFMQEGLDSLLPGLDNDGTEVERAAFNKLPHRTSYFNGLHGFVIDYQFRITTLNEQVFQAIDQMKTVADPGDIVWQKTLTEIDRREWKATPHENIPGIVIIQASYNTEIQEFMDSGKDFVDHQRTSGKYAQLLKKAFENETEPITWNDWSACYEYYTEGHGPDFLMDRPVTLAQIGLKQFANMISNVQLNWCIAMIQQTAVFILNETMNQQDFHSYPAEKHYNLHEKSIALQSIHLAMAYSDQEETPEIIAFLINLLNANFANYEVDRFTPYFRTVFYELYPAIVKRVWSGLIELSKFKILNTRVPYLDQQAVNELKQKEQAFITDLSKSVNPALVFDELNFADYDAHLLNQVLFITPFCNTSDPDFSKFTIKFIGLLIDDLHLKVEYGHTRSQESRRILHRTTTRVEFYLAELLMLSDIVLSRAIIDLIVDPVLTGDKSIIYRRDRGLSDFCKQVPEQFIWKLDLATYDSKDDGYKSKLIGHFWQVWEYFFLRVKAAGGSIFARNLLFDVGWKVEALDWVVLTNKKEFYREMVEAIGPGHAKSIVKCLSTVGEKTFLPAGLSWLATIIRRHPDDVISLISIDGERLIKRLFYNHIAKIKAEKSLIDDFLFLLNKMVDMGSSQAYLFRENVITYKSVA